MSEVVVRKNVRRNLNAWWLAAFAGCSALVVPELALAQDASETAVHSGQLDEIIVTARKREESLMSVPVAVTAVSGEALTNTGVADLSRLATIAPQVMVSRADTGSGGSFKIRGLGTPYSDAGLDSSVGVNIDGMQAMRGNGVNIGFFDVAQIEVLKGPQALFFGKNNPAGVISLRSKNPTDQFEGYIRASYEFEAREKIIEGAISGPISDTLKGRLALRGGKMTGWLRNRAVAIPDNPVMGGFDTFPRDSKGNGGKDIMGRATLLWEPSSDFDANLKVAAGTHKDNGTTGQVVCFHSGPPVDFGLGAIPYPDPGGDCKIDKNFTQSNMPAEIAKVTPYSRGGAQYTDIKTLLTTLNMNYHLDNLTLTSVSGFTKLNAKQQTDFSFSSHASVPCQIGENSQTFSQEFRLASDFDGPVNFTIGAYYEDWKRRNRTACFLGFVGPDPLTGRYDTQGNRIISSGDTISGFGQVRWALSEKFELAGGVRYTREKKKTDILNTYAHGFLQQGFALQPVGVPLPGDFTFSDSNWSPEFTASYKPNSESLLYIAYKTGYKSGGFSSPNLVQTFMTADNLRFDSETSKGFEAGFKAQLANRSIRVEGAIYSFIYKGLQLSQFDQNSFGYFIKNAASARIKGAELSVLWQATDELRLNATATYNKAIFKSYPGASCYSGQSVAEGCVGGSQDLTGAPLTQAPKHTLNGGFIYDLPLGNSDLKLAFAGDAAYTGSYFTAEDHHPVTLQKSYTLFNASLRLHPEDDRWEVSLIGRNLGNKFYKMVSSGKPFAYSDEYFTFTPRAREIRIQVGYNF